MPFTVAQHAELPETMRIVLGQSSAAQSLNAVVAEIAKTDISVLLRGESGTGKEVYAQLIHRLSNPEAANLKRLNCRALDAIQISKQLEAWVREASTDHGACGTLYIDEIEDLDLAAQRTLLSFLPDGEADSQMGTLPYRLVCSTSRELERDVESGRFRRELYFRINGVCLQLPPLRERKEDIPALMEFFLAKYANGLFARRMPVLTAEEWSLLEAHNWPGNIRELENLAKKIVALSDTKMAMVDLRTTPLAPVPHSSPAAVSSLKVVARAASRQAEKELILQALERTRWNRKRAARDLQISYKSLLYKIKQIGVQEKESEALRGGDHD